jgi:hypothetical protein
MFGSLRRSQVKDRAIDVGDRQLSGGEQFTKLLDRRFLNVRNNSKGACQPFNSPMSVPSGSIGVKFSSARSSTAVPNAARTIRKHARAQVLRFSWR